jgi:DNA replication protein DnaC
MEDVSTLKSVPCPICHGTGWEKVEDSEAVKRCRCTLDSKTARLLERARIPKRYEHCDLRNYEGHNESQKKAKVIASKFVHEYPLVDVGLLFLGPCGVGKTHLSVAILKSLVMEKMVSCLFYDFRELIREIQNSYNPAAGTSEIKILSPVLETDILVLDELAASKPTAWVSDTVSYIINSRYNEKKITIFTSNFLDDPPKPGDERLVDRIGQRLRSRLYEMCKDVVITAEDYRKHVRQAKYRF